MKKRPDLSLIVNKVNAVLTNNQKEKHLKVVAASFNIQGNMIVSTCSDQTAEELIKFQDSFTHILTDIHSERTAILREDKKWSSTLQKQSTWSS